MPRQLILYLIGLIFPKVVAPQEEEEEEEKYFVYSRR
jgi:hypothetical protein